MTQPVGQNRSAPRPAQGLDPVWRRLAAPCRYFGRRVSPEPPPEPGVPGVQQRLPAGP